MKKIIATLLMLVSLSALAQTYSAKDIVGTLKTFGTHMIYLEGPRMLVGGYETVSVEDSFFKIVLTGELFAAGQNFGKLYQCITFDARDISNNVTVEPFLDQTGGTNRWDVVLRTKNNKYLIHFRNEQITLSNNTHFIRIHQDVPEIRLMFMSEDAANKFKTIAKGFFR